ncbi:MAG: D-tyrosyl-tRNA(Tyr) deacylase [Bacteroidales bacterium]|nr:D-tyrosyl-tRNA(Tyr) deacylase [Bacteroidales bacterium]
MRTVIQRVSEANVRIDDIITASIKTGLLIFLGIEETDNNEDIQWLSGKIVRIRIFNDNEGVMNLSVKEIDGEILVISQFTLHSSTRKGNRPSYIRAAKPEIAIPLYNMFLKQLETDLGKPIKSGIFGEDMKIKLINDGPVTIIIDTKNKE